MDPGEQEKFEKMTQDLEGSIVEIMKAVLAGADKEALKANMDNISQEESAWADKQAQLYLERLKAWGGVGKNYLDKKNWNISGRSAQVTCEFMGAVADIRDPDGRAGHLLRTWVSEFLERPLEDGDLQEIPPVPGEVYGKKIVFNVSV